MCACIHRARTLRHMFVCIYLTLSSHCAALCTRLYLQFKFHYTKSVYITTLHWGFTVSDTLLLDTEALLYFKRFHNLSYIPLHNKISVSAPIYQSDETSMSSSFCCKLVFTLVLSLSFFDTNTQSWEVCHFRYILLQSV